jgi:guanylate kinase
VLDSLNDYPTTVIVGDTSTIKQLAKLLKDSFESIYIMTDYVSLIERMLKLGHTNEEIKHHLEYAENNGEFESWKFATHVVKNVSTEEKAMNQILSIMGLTEMLPVEKIKALTSRRVTE